MDTNEDEAKVTEREKECDRWHHEQREAGDLRNQAGKRLCLKCVGIGGCKACNGRGWIEV